MTTVELRCRCGDTRGLLTSPMRANRVTCYCDDCQAFARFLGRTDVLDARGGTDIVQVTPSQIMVDVARLRSMRLSDKGLLRWYTACCKTPAGNMLFTARSPFVGLPSAFFSPGEGRSLDDVTVPSLGGILGRFAIGGCPPGVHPSASPGLLLQSAAFLLRSVVGGRHRPSCYFDPDTGAPRQAPQVLSSAERAAL